MIMPTPKPSWTWVVRRYNWKTGEHKIVDKYDTKEEASDRVRVLSQILSSSNSEEFPFNYEYEKVEKGRPDLHHERLKEEWGYKSDID